MTSDMRRIVMAMVCVMALVCVLAGCFNDSKANGGEGMTCSEAREEVVMSCQDSFEDMTECNRQECLADASDEESVEYCEGLADEDVPLHGLCETEINAFNDCTIQKTDDLSMSVSEEEAVAAGTLAYWCDFKQDEVFCEKAESDAAELGVMDCPLPGDF